VLVEPVRLSRGRESVARGFGIVVEDARVLEEGPENVNRGSVSDEETKEAPFFIRAK
jgi:hypothetical protein